VTEPPPATQHIVWFYAEDLDETCRFYEEALGFEQVFDEGKARIFRAGANVFIGICSAWGDRKVQTDGAMFTFVTDEVDAWHERLKAHGARIGGEPHMLDEFNIYTLFARDPNGYRLEFQQFLDPAWPKPA
jgi:predicted enzyme related to lactoylglutathione lyase